MVLIVYTSFQMAIFLSHLFVLQHLGRTDNFSLTLASHSLPSWVLLFFL